MNERALVAARAAALVALLAGACGRSAAPPAAGGEPWFRETAREAGLVFEHRSGHRDAYYMPEIMGGGAALFDMDDDGDLDAYLVQSGSLVERDAVDRTGGASGANRLFENDGAGRFSDVTAASGAGDRGYGMGAACADVDEDGDTDLYVTNLGRNTLLANQGGARFRDETERAGIGHEGWGASAGFLDADRDGDLDLFVTNYLEWSVETEIPCLNSQSRPDYCSPKNYGTPARDAFYLNQGDGRFVDASVSSGVAAQAGTGLGVGFGDFDGDGWQDVFVANDGMPDHLWRNLGGDAFENVAMAWGCGVDADGLAKAGMGVALADVDGDMDLDLVVCNLRGESDSLFLNGGGYFADRTASAGLAAVSTSFTRFGMALADLDNDGHLDLFQANGRVQRAGDGPGDGSAGDPYAEANLLLRGDAEARFREVSPRGGTEAPLVATSRAAAFGDVDGDGATDVLVVNRDGPAHLLHNLTGRAGRDRRWILLRVLERSGRDALGAELAVEVDGRTVRRDVRAAYSYLASNDPRVHLGLGAAGRVEAVRVRWVDGEEERFGPFEANRTHVLRRGAGAAVRGDG